MCRWIAYYGEPIPLEDLIVKPSHSLLAQSLGCREGVTRTNGDGYGIGWYGPGSEPGIFRETLPAWRDPNIRVLAKRVVSPLMFAHVRASTGTTVTLANCHPFSHARWMFMHNGQIGGYDRLRNALEALLCAELRACRAGTTDSELIFLLMIQNGLDSDPVEALRSTLAEISGVARTSGVREPLKLTVCFSDGERLLACRHSGGGPAPSLYWQRRSTGLVVASEPNGCDLSPWNAVAENSVLTVEGGITCGPLGPPLAAAA